MAGGALNLLFAKQDCANNCSKVVLYVPAFILGTVNSILEPEPWHMTLKPGNDTSLCTVRYVLFPNVEIVQLKQ